MTNSDQVDPGIQHAWQFIRAVEDMVVKVDDWGYALALRFDAYDRSHGQALMVRGGHLSISCGFAVDRQRSRWLLFGIWIESRAGDWSLKVDVEDEDEDGSVFRWESLATSVSTLDEFVVILPRALEVLDTCIQIPEIARAFELIQARKRA